MTWMALFSARSPPRLSRWRVVWPLEAWNRAGAGELGEGGVAAAASGVGKRHDGLGGADRGRFRVVEQSGNQVADDGGELSAVGGQRSGGVAQGQGQSADLALADGLLSAGVGRQAAASQAGQDGVGQPRSG